MIDTDKYEEQLGTTMRYMNRFYNMDWDKEFEPCPHCDEKKWPDSSCSCGYARIPDILMHVQWSHDELFEPLHETASDLLTEVKRLREELDTIKSRRSFEHRFSPTGYGMAIEAWIGLTETGNGHWNDDKRSDFADLRLLTEEEWWQWQGEEIDWLWNHDEIKDALDYAHHTYLRKCIDMLKEEGGIMALKKRLQESEEE